MHTRLLARAQRRHAVLKRLAALDAERSDLLRRFPELSLRSPCRRVISSRVATDQPEPQERSWVDSLLRH